MAQTPKPKGTWFNRFLIYLLSIVLGILIFWLLGFVLNDIRTTKGPQYNDIEKTYVTQTYLDKKKALENDITLLDISINNKKEQKRIISDTSESLQKTVSQLIELQKVNAEKGLKNTEELDKLTVSLGSFLESQKDYQDINSSIAKLSAEKQQLKNELREIASSIEKQKEPARKEYEKLYKLHRLKLAGIQTTVLVPLLIIAVFFALKKRKSIYYPLILAFLLATLLKMALVMHEYFPSKYFKYILIIVILLVVVKLLVFLIKTIAFPKTHTLIKQYRQAYERFLCPICEYPIQRGPRKFLYWTRRTVKKLALPETDQTEEKPYSCPSCGTKLFEKCNKCGEIRHTLLPACRHCGDKNETAN